MLALLLALFTQVAPVERIAYDPLGLTDEHRTATVFCDLSHPVPDGGRRVMIDAQGGGWAPTSGLPWTTLGDNLPDEALAKRWVSSGHVLVSFGYTVGNDPASAATSKGCFTLEPWDAQGRIDPTDLDWRCAELDFVNLMQHLVHTGFSVVDGAITRPGSVWVKCRSAGCTGALWCWGHERASQDPLYAGTRFARSTEIAGIVAENFFAAFTAMDSTVGFPHFLNAAGTAVAPNWQMAPFATRLACTVTEYGAHLRPKPPMFLTAGNTFTFWTGPWGPTQFVNVLPGTGGPHSPNHVEAVANACGGHDPRSVFVAGLPTGDFDVQAWSFIWRCEATR